ncbi:TlpA family protein disulfide reductase [Occallatibacter riparius]|uniref:TlpA family protein disulfide reductase n=1 Tax=Occallatibacter riparius TaxID=1002689 RepID=A0A9J7BHA0_9BACT|nr:TlpA disulfide reductase family protein [Occallatibacter riparius]UWZ82348.1 TlpA family protein disulfide reductase [Occallatibacter riparius]
MVRSLVLFLVCAASSLAAQSRVDLLKQVADHYNNSDSFSVKGTASALMPGSSWRVTYDFDTEGAQPAFLPLDLRKPSIQVLSQMGNMKQALAVPGTTDPLPQKFTVQLLPLGQYNAIAMKLTDAQKIGAESVTVDGRSYSCEIIDATYDYSPAFKPNSAIEHKRFWIDPATLIVLRETRSMPDHPGSEWTGTVTSFSFNLPPSETILKALARFATLPKDRPEWVGRSLPDLALAQLSGPQIKLATLKGKPVLLDFWGSYCAPCNRTTLHAQELQQRYKSSALIVLTFTQDTAADARAWTGYNHVTLPVLLDPDGTAFKALDIQGVPVAILVGADGKIVHYWVGLDDLASMDSSIAEILSAHAAATSKSRE